nr:MAG TPA: hypothetical protein [Siphovirus LN-2020-1]
MKGIAVSKNQDEKLRVPSAVGDWALLVVGGQLNHMQDCTPAGWTGKYAHGEDIRSCTVAVKMVADPADTQNVVWKSPDPAHNGRHVAVLMVFDGGKVKSLVPRVPGGSADAWKDGPFPQITGFVQHDIAALPVATFPPNVESLTNGSWGKDTNQSWSSIVVGYAQSPYVPPTETGVKTLFGVDVQLQEQTGSLDPSLADGSGVRVTVWDGARETPTSTMRAIPGGAKTIAELLSTPHFIVGHRGGSQSWPEHTELGYTQAVDYHAHALEFSAARSKDGVWFGCHDKSLSRLVPALTKNADEYTWAEIKAEASKTQYLPATIDWLIDTYSKSHVIVFDPKHKLGEWEAVCDMFKGMEQKVILKAYYDSKWAFDMMRERGFKTWGYAYNADIGKANYPDFLTGKVCDILSMEFDAPQTTWDSLKASGLPTVAHIPADLDQLKTGWSRGATGAIVSGMAAALERAA